MRVCNDMNMYVCMYMCERESVCMHIYDTLVCMHTKLLYIHVDTYTYIFIYSYKYIHVIGISHHNTSRSGYIYT